MADAAAFFASKKKKKKAFKFNANKIDASTVEKKVHVDAPALSTDNDAVGAASAVTTAADTNDGVEQWDDGALTATLAPKKAVPANNTAELLDMKALDLKGSEQGDIQEKLRLEENKAKLTAAREGMEKEALRLKEQKEKKDQDGTGTAGKPRFGGGARFGAAAAGMSASGGKWLPPHMRGGGAPLSIRMGGGMGGSGMQKLDTEDENLFPDLASADAIIEKQKQQGPAYRVPKKTPVGGGATWGSKVKPKIKKPTPTPTPEPTETEKTEAAAPLATAPEPAPASTVVKAPIKPKKKKKKDLSTFKPSA